MIVSSWIGLLGPRDMPPAAVQRISEVASNILRQPDFQQRMVGNSMEIRGGTPAAFKAYIQADAAKWSALAKTVNLKLQ